MRGTSVYFQIFHNALFFIMDQFWVLSSFLFLILMHLLEQSLVLSCFFNSLSILSHSVLYYFSSCSAVVFSSIRIYPTFFCDVFIWQYCLTLNVFFYASSISNLFLFSCPIPDFSANISALYAKVTGYPVFYVQYHAQCASGCWGGWGWGGGWGPMGEVQASLTLYKFLISQAF